MSLITLYKGENFALTKDPISSNTSDYRTLSEVKSLQVSGGTWIVYSEANYNGEIAVYKPGDYKSELKISKIKSLQKFTGTLEEQDINVYEQSNCTGNKYDIKNPDNPTVPYPIRSHHVVNGIWFLYDGTAYTGKKIISITGDPVSDETSAGLAGPVKSLMAYAIYEPNN